MIKQYWLKLANTYYAMCRTQAARKSLFELGKRAAQRAIEEEANNVYRLPPIPGNTVVYSRKKFLRF